MAAAKKAKRKCSIRCQTAQVRQITCSCQACGGRGHASHSITFEDLRTLLDHKLMTEAAMSQVEVKAWVSILVACDEAERSVGRRTLRRKAA